MKMEASWLQLIRLCWRSADNQRDILRRPRAFPGWAPRQRLDCRFLKTARLKIPYRSRCRRQCAQPIDCSATAKSRAHLRDNADDNASNRLRDLKSDF